jgi:hypothetical protein
MPERAPISRAARPLVVRAPVRVGCPPWADARAVSPTRRDSSGRNPAARRLPIRWTGWRTVLGKALGELSSGTVVIEIIGTLDWHPLLGCSDLTPR